MAKWFSDTVRYLDDLLTLNNGNFEEEITNMYIHLIFQLVYGVVNMVLWSMTKGTLLI